MERKIITKSRSSHKTSSKERKPGSEEKKVKTFKKYIQLFKLIPFSPPSLVP